MIDTSPAVPEVCTPPPLSPGHQRLIVESSITPDCAAARGYWSATKKQEVKDLGFAPSQSLVPALVIPTWDVYGERRSHQIRPDQPREKDGRRLKYETPHGSSMHVDSHPWNLRRLGEAGTPIIITEGARKADSAVSRGQLALSLAGVWSWRGKNAVGGFTGLADWESIHLKKRETFLCFDSDVVTKPEVYQSLARLKKFLESRGAEVWIIYLPGGEAGGKVGMDDYFAAEHSSDELYALGVRELREPPRRERVDGRMVSDYLPDTPWPQLVVPAPYFLREDATGMMKPLGELGGETDARIAESPVLITGILKDVDDGGEALRLAWRRRGRWDHLTADRGAAMETRKLTELASRGFPVASDNAKDLVSYFRRFEAANLDQLPVAMISAHLGWQGAGGEDGFIYGRHLIGDLEGEAA